MGIIKTIQNCVDGCGRTRIIRHDELVPPPVFFWEAEQEATAQANLEAPAKAQADFEAKVAEALNSPAAQAKISAAVDAAIEAKLP